MKTENAIPLGGLGTFLAVATGAPPWLSILCGTATAIITVPKAVKILYHGGRWLHQRISNKSRSHA